MCKWIYNMSRIKLASLFQTSHNITQVPYWDRTCLYRKTSFWSKEIWCVARPSVLVVPSSLYWNGIKPMVAWELIDKYQRTNRCLYLVFLKWNVLTNHAAMEWNVLTNHAAKLGIVLNLYLAWINLREDHAHVFLCRCILNCCHSRSCCHSYGDFTSEGQKVLATIFFLFTWVHLYKSGSVYIKYEPWSFMPCNMDSVARLVALQL